MPADPHPPAPTVLDPAQLNRIESTHRGFLYQHLYVVGCLLLAQNAGVSEVLVERDEDVELRLNDSHIYIQVKTRSAPLTLSDISGALDRFAIIRKLHAAEVSPKRADSIAKGIETSPQRVGSASFAIVANVAPGPGLLSDLSESSWPADVSVLWPGGPAITREGLAPAWSSVEDAVEWCTEHARLPYSQVAPTTLVWKLAALAQAAAMGGVGASVKAHCFVVEQLADLFEQVVRSVHELPSAPEPYWQQENEPTSLSDAPVHLVVGPTGSGKTAWAAVRAAHDPRPTLYFAASEAGAPFAAALVREISSQFLADSRGHLSSVLMPGATGLDALRALGLLVRERGQMPVLVIDDVQRLESDGVLQCIAAAPDFRWVLLSHPGPTATQIEARLGIQAAKLAGWSLDTIAAAMRAADSAADAPTCNRVRSLTGGLPLFVRNFAQLAQTRYGGNVSELCDQLEEGDHFEHTAQEVLLSGTLDSLAPPSRLVAEVLGLAAIPLTGQEVSRLTDAAGITAQATTRSLRDLSAWGVMRTARGGKVQLHDAFRLLCDGSVLEAMSRRAILRRLYEVLDSTTAGFELDRGARFLKLLPTIGETERLVDIASNEIEQLIELGLERHLLDVLRATAADITMDADGRFWSLDTLAFLALHHGQTTEAAERVSSMEALASEHALGVRAQQALQVKHLLLAGKRGDAHAARRAYEALLASSGVDHTLRRIARYNFAYCLFITGDYEGAAEESSSLAMEYYDALGLDPAKVVGASGQEVVNMLAESEAAQPNIKRLADALDLFASARGRLHENYGLAKVHAFKFYTICGAFQSAIRTGQDFVDDMLKMNDVDGARLFLERTLLPSIQELGLVDHVVAVRGQYAVVLAYSGDVPMAREEMQRLRTFGEASSPVQREELRRQEAIIAGVAAGEVKRSSRPTIQIGKTVEPVRSRNRTASQPGRNEPCSCGSGIKFKRCCGG